jgi:hypothetical protein
MGRKWVSGAFYTPETGLLRIAKIVVEVSIIQKG